MSSLICWKCNRSIVPIERVERDAKTKKRWAISSCPFERCKANLDLKEVHTKLWNGRYFYDETDPSANESEPGS